MIDDNNQEYSDTNVASEDNALCVDTLIKTSHVTKDISARKTYSKIALILVLIDLLAGVGQIVLGMVVRDIGAASTENTMLWVATFLPLYGVAIPIGVMLFNRMPKATAEPSSLSRKDFTFYLLCCFPMMYLGNLIGTLLSWALSSGTSSNALYDYAFSTNPIKVVVIVFMAPLLEEFVFRKMIIDHTSMYGEHYAILVSGLTFGLFHENLYQFFYAFALGMVFAVVYLRTRKLRYSVCMHAILNFLGAVVAPWIVSKVDLKGLMKLEQQILGGELPTDTDYLVQVASSFVGLLIYVVILLSVAIIGGSLFLRAKKRNDERISILFRNDSSVSKRAVFLNTGMIIFYVICAAAIVLALI